MTDTDVPPVNTDTAHLDGFRAVIEKDDGYTKVAIRLCAEGKPAPHLFPGLFVFRKPAALADDAGLERAMIVAMAMCTFMNAGGDKNDLYIMVDVFCSGVPSVLPGDPKLVSVLPPPGGTMFIWKMPDETYLKVVQGDEGFSEVMSEQELAESLRAQAEGDEETGNPWL